MFDLEDAADKAYSLFEVVNTLEWTDDQLLGLLVKWYHIALSRRSQEIDTPTDRHIQVGGVNGSARWSPKPEVRVRILVDLPEGGMEWIIMKTK